MSLIFDGNAYTVKSIKVGGCEVSFRAYENRIYVEQPVDVGHQYINIYVPERSEWEKPPIFFPNGVGGYMPAQPLEPGFGRDGGPNTTLRALMHGYVVATPAVRGRTLQNEAGEYIGAAPAVIVDLKAAVRYLRYNQKRLPGDTDKIISNGTSAGGALSSLLGATGNHPDYEPYLKELGAADARDDIFAASCYCPITNLDHADMAYEWEFCGINEYHGWGGEGVMTQEQQALSPLLKQLFPAYLNGLALQDEEGRMLRLDADGNGSFKEYIQAYVVESAKRAVQEGRDLSELSWITWNQGEPADVNFEEYVKYRTRMKTTPAFDSIAMGTPENELFGTRTIRERHFTIFNQDHSAVQGELAEEQPVRMMNPMNYISDPASVTAKYYRIRHGAIDRDTSLAISAMLTARLRMEGTNVDYHLPWGVVHAGDYDLEELFAWIDEICR